MMNKVMRLRGDVAVLGDEDADHDRAREEDEGVDALLVEADLAGGLLVEGYVALRCVRYEIALRWVWLVAASGWFGLVGVRLEAREAGGRVDRGQDHDLAKLPRQ